MRGHREGRLAWALVAALALACGLPVLAVRYAPLQDLPSHLLIASILSDPAKFRGAFQADLGFAPYSAYYAIVAALARFLPLVLAGKLVVAVTMAAIPVSVLLLVASTGRRPGWIALAAFPAGFTQIYFLGFASFLLAIPAYLLGLAALSLLLRGQRGAAAGAGVLAAGLFIYLAHPMVLGLYGLSVLVLAGWRARAVLRHPGQLLVVVAAGVLLPGATILSGAVGGVLSDPSAVQFVSPLFTARFFADSHVGLYTFPWNALSIAGAALLVCGALLGLGRRGSIRERDVAGALTILALLAVLMFALPFRRGISPTYVNVRLAPLLTLWLVIVLALLSRPPSDGAAARGRTPILLGIALLLVNAWSAHVRFDAEARSVEPAFAAMRPGARVLPLCFDRHSRVFAPRHWNDLYLHFQDYYHARNGGIDPYVLTNPLVPVLYRGELIETPGEYRPERFRWSAHGGGFDYFLVRGPARGRAKEELEGSTRLVVASPPWFLSEPPARE